MAAGLLTGSQTVAEKRGKTCLCVPAVSGEKVQHVFSRGEHGRFGVRPGGYVAGLLGLIGLGFSGAAASAQGLDCNAPPPGAPERSENCDLGFVSKENSYAYAVSADGRVVVGLMDTSDGFRAFRWTDAGTDDLGSPFGGTLSFAQGISDDGTVVVGASADSSGNLQAFRWTQAGGMVNLGRLPGGLSSHANDANADGSVVVGRSESGVGTRAFRWTEAGMVDLGALPGGVRSLAFGVNADGSVVVGQSST